MAIERLKKLKEDGKPFALFLSIGTPHDPWAPYKVHKDAYGDCKYRLGKE